MANIIGLIQTYKRAWMFAQADAPDPQGPTIDQVFATNDRLLASSGVANGRITPMFTAACACSDNDDGDWLADMLRNSPRINSQPAPTRT